MNQHNTIKRLALGLMLTLIAGLGWRGAVAEKRDPAEVVGSEALGGKDRYLAYVSTDKPIYRAGEKVYMRSIVLRADNHEPLGQQPGGQFDIKGPKGNTVASGFVATQDSVSGFAWEVPQGQAGGEYRCQVSYPSLGIAPSARKFDIRAYRAPRIKTQIQFFRDGYGPGDSVGATLEATRAEGGAPANARVTITARVDGKEVHRSTAFVDNDGNCTALFNLPKKIKRGDGTLVFAIEDGGVVETATKTIPILLQTVDLSIYPEGGELVAGLPCRVYLEARTPFQKPADIAGIVVDSKDGQVGAFRTEHEGRGRFVFVPEKGEIYRLRITEPAGITTTFDLPAALGIGTQIQTVSDVYEPRGPIELRVLSTDKGPLTVTLSQREVELGSLEIRGAGKAGEQVTADVTLNPPSKVDGVLIATVWDSENRALAERLLYRRPARRVDVTIDADKTRYIPGGKVTLELQATDERGRPAEAVVGLTVTDDSVLEMIEKREQAPRLPAMVMLEHDVRELADAHVYLNPDDPEAPLALDLLLGTQGWRRFAFMRVTDFLKEHGDRARRTLAMRVVTEREKIEVRRKAGLLRGLAARAVRRDMPMAAAAIPEMAVMDAAEGAEMAEADKDRQEAPAEAPVPVAEPVPPPVVAAPPVGRKPQRPQAKKEFADALVMAKRREALFEIAADEEVMAERIAIVTVREYAHRVRPNRKPTDRVDFTETLYWNAGVRTDAKTGKATVSFDLSDAVTAFRVTADAFTQKGALGAGSSLVESVQPFYAEPKLPLEVTMGDRILLPVGVVNSTDAALSEALLEIAAAKGIRVGELNGFDIAADARVRQIVELMIGDIAGVTDFALDVTAGPYRDRVTRKLKVVPRGFPVEIGEGGLLGPDASLSFNVNIPKTRVAGSVTTEIAVYPTPLANLTAALERLIREPNGCFEQTSSSTYPLVMAQQYFLSHQGVDPKLIERSRQLLDKGYKRLTGYECKKKGYEWFGQDPGHEALTAYGLLEFTDMAEVHNVDTEMLARTREWLLGTRDGKGGFKRARRALHTWIADPDCSNAYITWALLVAGEKPESLTAEVDGVKQAAGKNKNSYVIALGANVAQLAGDEDTAKALAAKLAGLQAKDGKVEGGTTTIVGSGGIALEVETTALAVLAWLPHPAQAGAVESGIKWLADVCKGGRYGSTQSTVLALRAILAYDAARAKPKAPGSVQLMVDGRQAGSAVKFDKDTHGPIKLTDIAELLEPGNHKIEIKMTGGSEMPCAVAVNYANEKPDSSKECKVGVKVSLAAADVKEGDAVEANVSVVNRAEDEIIPTPIAIVGIPGGLEVRHDQLKELVKAERIAAYEVIGREVVLYWRELKAEQRVDVPISLVAAIPGTYTAPASRAYLYYTDEFKTWADPMKVTITPTGE